jgi:hypothetical protein
MAGLLFKISSDSCTRGGRDSDFVSADEASSSSLADGESARARPLLTKVSSLVEVAGLPRSDSPRGRPLGLIAVLVGGRAGRMYAPDILESRLSSKGSSEKWEVSGSEKF